MLYDIKKTAGSKSFTAVSLHLNYIMPGNFYSTADKRRWLPIRNRRK